MINLKLAHTKDFTLMCMRMFVLGSTFVMSQAYANPAEYYVGNYQAVGYDKQTSMPYKLNLRIEKGKAHFLAIHYRRDDRHYLGYLQKLVNNDGYHFILKSHSKISKKNLNKMVEPINIHISYCNYLHNSASMSAEINCHGSLIGNEGYFSLVMQ